MDFRQRRANHKRAAQLHLDTRMSQRMGVHFNRSQTKELIDFIRSGKIAERWESKPGRYWYRLEYDHRKFAWFLYDKSLKRIVTCLPDEEIPRDVWEQEQAKMHEEAL